MASNSIPRNEAGDITFDDLGDDFERELQQPADPVRHNEAHDDEQDRMVRETVGAIEASRPTAEYVEKCGKCRGTGSFISYTGRIVGPCFTCKGTGRRTFKTSPEQRERTRTRAKRSKERKAEQRLEAFEAEHGELYAWLQEAAGWNRFAASLLAGIEKYGSLTDNQLAAAGRAKEKDEARQAERKAEQEQRAKAEGKAQTDIDLTPVPAGTYAVPGGDTRLKVRIRKPGKRSKWHGYVFVDDGAEYGNRNNYGRQVPGGLYTGSIENELRAIIADPLEASMAYGRLVGVCGVCGRKLEDEESVALGIGPVCRGKF